LKIPRPFAAVVRRLARVRRIGEEFSARTQAPRGQTHIPGNPPLPFIASIWRTSYFWFPPLTIFITFCIC